MLVITIEEYKSMLGRYHYSLARNGKVFSMRKDAGYDPQAAAATAVRLSMEYCTDYVILAPKKVMDCIPENLRSGNWRN